MKSHPQPHARTLWFLQPLLLTGLLGFHAFSHAAEPVYKTPLNDTGVTACFTTSRYYNHRCPAPGFPGQDAEFGRDKTHNDKTDGRAGFSFTKINSKGHAVAAKAARWNCVKDNVTGLMWEVKTHDRGLHDRRWLYSWYQPESQINGGGTGVENGGKCYRNQGCDTYHYVEAVNQQGWCGYQDWRLPTVEELTNVTDFSGKHPSSLYAPDANYFPDVKLAETTFWSSSPMDGDHAWGFSVDPLHFIRYEWKSEALSVRLVRSGH